MGAFTRHTHIIIIAIVVLQPVLLPSTGRCFTDDRPITAQLLASIAAEPSAMTYTPLSQHASVRRLLGVDSALLLSLPASAVHHGLEPTLEQPADAGVRHGRHHHGLYCHVVTEAHVESCTPQGSISWASDSSW